MKKTLFIFSLFSLALSTVFAQEKKGCNPSACKPGDTKVEEAAVITNLRDSLITFKQEASSVNLLINETEIQIGQNESESLVIMASEINALEKALHRPVTDFSGLKEARFVRQLQSSLKALSR